MQFIQGQHRQQNYFATLEDQVAPGTIKKAKPVKRVIVLKRIVQMRVKPVF